MTTSTDNLPEWSVLKVTLDIFWHPLYVTIAYHANVTRSECQKYANVTPSQCQKNANSDAIWVLSIKRRNQVFAFLGGKDGKKLILTYVVVFMGARSLIFEKFLLCDRVPLVMDVIYMIGYFLRCYEIKKW